MSLVRSAGITVSWILLMAITLVSVATAEYSGDHRLSVGIVMAIAAVKAVLILWRFMDLRGAPTGIRRYLLSWVIACATMIAALYWVGDVTVG